MDGAIPLLPPFALLVWTGTMYLISELQEPFVKNSDPRSWLYRVIRNDCRGFNNLSYTIYLR